jgi:hypothetical protein
MRGGSLGGSEKPSTPLDGVLARSERSDLLDVLGKRLSGTDLTTLLLEVMRHRASALSPPEVLGSYQRDRFVTPGPVPFGRLRATEDALLASLPSNFETLVLAPLVPLGTHSALGPIDQNRIVSTMRRTEVAADPTNALALEAAVRRRAMLAADPRSAERVRLGAFQRVVRAQRFQSEGAMAHFHLLGLATAGRDVGDLRFERESATEHVRFAALALLRAGVSRVRVELTDFTEGDATAICDAVRHALADSSEVEVVDRPDRQEARGYYAPFCFKARAVIEDSTFEIADGGLVDWTQRLVPSRKERLFISGLGVERLALAMDPDFRPAPDEA